MLSLQVISTSAVIVLLSVIMFATVDSKVSKRTIQQLICNKSAMDDYNKYDDENLSYIILRQNMSLVLSPSGVNTFVTIPWNMSEIDMEPKYFYLYTYPKKDLLGVDANGRLIKESQETPDNRTFFSLISISPKFRFNSFLNFSKLYCVNRSPSGRPDDTGQHYITSLSTSADGIKLPKNCTCKKLGGKECGKKQIRRAESRGYLVLMKQSSLVPALLRRCRRFVRKSYKKFSN